MEAERLRDMGNRLELQRQPEANRSGASQHNRGRLDFVGLARILFAKRSFIIGSTVAAGILAAAITLLIPNKYTSTASILPSGSDKLSALKGMTGLSILDFARGAGGDANSSELFPTILTSERVQKTILQERFSFSIDGESQSLTLLEYLEEDNLDKARIDLGEIVSVSTEFKTGVITLSVTTEYPEFSSLIAEAYLKELDLFNRTQRTTKAKEYEKFIAGQLADTEQQLSEAENKLNEFQTANRDWAMSSDPDLQRELMQLKRELEVKTKTFIMLTQQHEIARADAQKDLPVVQVLDPPAIPLLKSAPKRTVMVISAMLAAFMIAIVSVFIRHSLNGALNDTSKDSVSALMSDVQSAFPKTFKRVSRHMSEGVQSKEERHLENAHTVTVGDPNDER